MFQLEQNFLIDCVRVGFSHLQEHKFRHKFVDTLNHFCACALESDCIEHFFLRCHSYISFWTTIMNELHDIDSSLVSRSSNDIFRVILYSDKRFNPCTNKIILTATIKYIKITQRSAQSLFWIYKNYPFHLFFFFFLFYLLVPICRHEWHEWNIHIGREQALLLLKK